MRIKADYCKLQITYPQPSRSLCGERPRIYAFPCHWGNEERSGVSRGAIFVDSNVTKIDTVLQVILLINVRLCHGNLLESTLTTMALPRDCHVVTRSVTPRNDIEYKL